MTSSPPDALRFPTGRFAPADGPVPPARREALVERIRRLPERARAAVQNLDDDALDTPYREGGWTPRQIVHHLADSHANAVIRMKLALTEDEPTIKPYDQAAWAELPDATGLPPGPSLALLDGLHVRWTALMASMSEEQWARTVVHPEIGTVPLTFFLQLYAWHGDHHVAQVEALRARMGW